MSDDEWPEPETVMSDSGLIMLPRTGGHLRIWGNGHTCDSPKGHEGNCVCECGLPAPV